jgi:ABC-type transport system involved in cytochrome c biogenesis permease subunit
MQNYVNILSFWSIFFYLTYYLIRVKLYVKDGAGIKSVQSILFVAGITTHFLGLALRSYLVGHAPMANLYETLFFFSFSVTLTTFIYNITYAVRFVEIISLPVALVLLVLALFSNHEVSPLFLALRTTWFSIHVMASFVAYAFFTLSFASAIFFLIFLRRGRKETRTLEEMANSANLWGFSLFSFAMFSGAIWAYLAWGNYWFWEPKSIWSFILWFYFAGIVHGHYLIRWQGKKVAYMTIFGFVVMMFTYVGIGLLMKSTHNL